MCYTFSLNLFKVNGCKMRGGSKWLFFWWREREEGSHAFFKIPDNRHIESYKCNDYDCFFFIRFLILK